jgi:SAM-dependent methyltransferase
MIDGWEDFWGEVLASDQGNSTLWDADPARAIEEDIARFMPYFDPALPLLDLGCGAGRQTIGLARHWESVIGIDKSSSAVKLARSISPDSTGILFRVVDVLDSGAIQSLHDELGDLNVYVRGVFHVIRPHMRHQYVSSLGVLLGKTGTLYQIELRWAAARCFQELPGLQAWRMPENVRLNAFELADQKRYFPDEQWLILEQGRGSIITAEDAGDGPVRFPATYLIVRRKQL